MVPSGRYVRGVRPLEELHVLRHIVALLAERFRIPFAALGGEEIAAIDVDGGAQPRDRVGHGMDDVVPKGLGVLLAQRLRPGGLDPAARPIAKAPPEDIVLAAGIDADDRPHLMIMRHDRYERRADYVEDGEIAGVMELVDATAPGFAQPVEHGIRIGDGAGDDLADCLMAGILCESAAAVGDEAVEIEHKGSHRRMTPSERIRPFRPRATRLPAAMRPRAPFRPI